MLDNQTTSLPSTYPTMIPPPKAAPAPSEVILIPTLTPGQHIVLRPSGLVGTVESIDHSDPPSFVFDHILGRQRIPIAHHDSYRLVVSAQRAAMIERELLEAAPIMGLMDPAQNLKVSDTSRRLDLYLAGTDDQRMAALATVLDWANAAIARGETHGLWRGTLTWARDHLLGELALARGMTPDSYEAQLLALRTTTPRRGPEVPAPVAPPAPNATVDFYPDEGRHDLGPIQVTHDLLVTQDVFSTHEDSVEDGGFVDALPGRWYGYVHAADDAVSPALSAAIGRHARNDEQREALLEQLSYLETRWLVMVHEDSIEFALEPPALVAVPEKARGGVGDFLGSLFGGRRGHTKPQDNDDAVARFLTSSRDPKAAIAALRWGVRGMDGQWTVLEEVGICHVDGGIIGLFASGPSADTARTLHYHTPDGTNAWPWGVIQALGGDGPMPIYGSPSWPREIIVIPC